VPCSASGRCCSRACEPTLHSSRQYSAEIQVVTLYDYSTHDHIESKTKDSHQSCLAHIPVAPTGQHEVVPPLDHSLQQRFDHAVPLGTPVVCKLRLPFSPLARSQQHFRNSSTRWDPECACWNWPSKAIECVTQQKATACCCWEIVPPQGGPEGSRMLMATLQLHQAGEG
jgi:hypothetical protein